MNSKFWSTGSSSDSDSDCDDEDWEPTAYALPNASDRWPLTTELLSIPITTCTKLLEVCMQLNTLAEGFARVAPSVRPVALDVAIADIGEETFYKVVLPGMQRCALDMESLFPRGELQRLEHHNQTLLTLSQMQARCLLCHAFFCNLTLSKWRASQANLNMRELLVAPETDTVAVGRLKCLLCYFHATSEDHDGQASITIQRNHVPSSMLPNWSALDTPICACAVSAKMRIEDIKNARIVDFANANLHIGRVISSCTQEEILFCICPELMPSMLICEQMEDDEAIMICNARQFSEYSGYRDSFRFVRAAPGTPRQDVIAMDAMPTAGKLEFTTDCLNRDMGKAFAGFSALGSDVPNISTGGWGCGVFGGDDMLKFCQQLIAATACHGHSDSFQLHYSSFGDEGLAQRYIQLHKMMADCSLTVSGLWEILLQGDTCEDFGSLLESTLRAMGG